MPQKRFILDGLQTKLVLLVFFLFIAVMLLYNYSKEKNEKVKIASTNFKVQLNLNNEKHSPIVEEKEEPPKSPLEAIWNYVYNRKYICKKKEYLGGKREDDVDGAYYLCKDDAVWPYPSKTEPPCLVYSFGIAWDFKFDDAIAKLGCEVHAFDPSMNLAEATKRESGVIFHKIGIAKEDNDHGFKGWKLRTLKTLMKELGHQDRALDYLKVDTDKGDGTGFEDTVMQELLDTGLYKCVRQYSQEIHMPGPRASSKNMDRCKLLYSQMTTLEKGGFRLYETVDNIRYVRSINPKITQEKIRQAQFAGSNDIVLWENHFVNVDFEGKCTKYL